VSGLADAVSSVAEREGMKIEPGAALLIAKKADGSMRDALSLLDQLSSFTEGPIDAEKAAEVLGMVKTELLAQISKAVIDHDTRAALDKLGEYVKGGGDSQELADGLAGYIRALLLIKSGVNDIELLELDSVEMESARELLGDIDMVDILRYFTSLADYKSSVKQGQDPVYSLEATLVKMSAMDRAVSLSALLGGAPAMAKASSPAAPKAETKPAPSRDTAAKPASNRPVTPEPAQAQPTKVSASLDGSPPTLDMVTNSWSDFCGVIKRDKAMLFGYLSICSLQGLQNGVLSLGIEGKFQLDQLSKQDNKRFIEDSLKDYFKSDIKINLKLIETGQTATPGAPPTLNPDKLFDGMPEARKLFDDLGGEIIGQ
jgi:DNA polymerase III subunit gamma/tau